MTEARFETAAPEDTRALVQRIAAMLRPGDVVLLHGDLGAGKTTMVQGIGAGLGVREQAQSPTFSLVIDTPLPDGTIMRHIDLYRLDDPHELDTLGFEDLSSDERAIVLVEWPERAADRLPDAYLLIDLRPIGADRRAIAVRAVGLGNRFDDLRPDR